jgi:hypothetical protein
MYLTKLFLFIFGYAVIYNLEIECLGLSAIACDRKSKVKFTNPAKWLEIFYLVCFSPTLSYAYASSGFYKGVFWAELERGCSGIPVRFIGCS